MTKLTLAELLELAKAHPPTDEDLRLQAESWVRGEMAMGNDAKEAADRAALEKK